MSKYTEIKEVNQAVKEIDRLNEHNRQLTEFLLNFIQGQRMIETGVNVQGGLSMIIGTIDEAEKFLEKTHNGAA